MKRIANVRPTELRTEREEVLVLSFQEPGRDELGGDGKGKAKIVFKDGNAVIGGGAMEGLRGSGFRGERVYCVFAVGS